MPFYHSYPTLGTLFSPKIVSSNRWVASCRSSGRMWAYRSRVIWALEWRICF